ncbi:MAG: S8/S53 family peptidase [Paucibacter sp.]|nr:S8/S53 family peptidase [Roseateles sp.]
MKFALKPLASAASLILTGLLTMNAAQAGSLKSKPAAIDNGPVSATDSTEVALALKVNNLADLQAFVASTVDPSSPNFHKFLKPEQFASRYGQSNAVVHQVTNYLQSQGLTVTRVFSNNLVVMVRGTNAQMASMFSTPIHSFSANGVSFQKPVGNVTVPVALQGVVHAVAGLSTEPRFESRKRKLPAAIVPTSTTALMPMAGVPGAYTVKDLANLYNINPLYAKGLTGAGKTLGIMTFASFNLADVSTYWTAMGQSGSTARITVVNTVPGSTISTDGDDETTLDVEQAGGVAPGANIVVYEAPNTDAGAIALYTKAITDNIADTLSISWGASEIYYDASAFAAYDNLFLQAAAQGVPIFAASADSGAYDIGNAYPYPHYSSLLAVDFPASSPMVLATGGTTLPMTINLRYGSVTVPTERPWGWDYLQSYIAVNYGMSYYYSNMFPSGGGGGVSVQYPVPSYQAGLPGVQLSAKGQTLYCFSNVASNPCTPGQNLGSLPGGFAGRNVPDVSLNGDPESGYSVYYQGNWITGFGGTSFVAPQLNGVFALISQQVGGRVGWLHPQLYGAFRTQGYGSGSPFRAITTGDNLYWHAWNGFNPATGLGSLDVANLAAIFSH